MNLRIVFEMRKDDREWTGRTNEGEFITLAQAQVWVENQVKAMRESAKADDPEVDMVDIYELGEFADEDGEPKDCRILCWFLPLDNFWDHVGSDMHVGMKS